jgi:hypothetical protein
VVLLLLSAAIIPGCKKAPDNTKTLEYNPKINPAEFVARVDHRYFPLIPGTVFHYRAETDEGTEINKVYVTHDTKEILGVTCTVVADSVWREGVILEATFDWYAQHQDGAVWYFGEAVDNFENGVLADHAGSWEAGQRGGEPGIIMKANPRVGDIYYQELDPGIVEDMGEVLSLSDSLTIPYAPFQHCLVTKDWTPLEPDIEANKYYAPGVGLVLEVFTKGSSERAELTDITKE